MQSIRNLFTKQSQINRLLVAYGSGQPIWTPTDYEQLAREGYKTNSYVYRCINLVAMACGGIPWLLYRKRGKNKRELDDHPLITLMQRPNPKQGDTKFIENVIAFLLLSGNSYVERVGPRNEPPRELYTLRPDRMRVVKGNAHQPVAGYEYRVDGQPFVFPDEMIMHLKTFNPLDDWYGLPPLSAAARSTDQSNEAKAWNVAMLQNSARPSGVLSTPDNLGVDQFDRLKSELEEKYQGQSNAGKPMLLEGGLEWKQISINPKDLEWVEGQKISAREIAMVFGVPSEMLGDSSNKTYSNYKEARQAFYMETVLPLMDWLRDEFNNWLTPLFGDNLYLDYDIDEIEAIQEDRSLVWKRSADAVKSGLLTINEARESMGYETHPDGDILLVPSSLHPLGQEEPEPEPPDDPPQQPNNEEDTKPTNDQKVKWKAFNLSTEEQKTAYWKSFDQLRSKWERAVQSQVTKRFEEELQQVVHVVRGSPNISSIESRALRAIDQKQWELLYKAIYTGIMEEFGERTLQGLKFMQIKQNRWLDAALEFIESAVGKVTQIIDTTKEQLQKVIAKGIAEGESIDQIASSIDQLYLEEIIPHRSVTIARTETISASNQASMVVAASTGLKLKKIWLSTKDTRTRDTHKIADGQSRRMDEKFSVGGEKMDQPGDITASPSNVINCRCTVIFESEDW